MQVGQTTYAIGRLARLSGLPVKTIRFYSDSGLLPPSARTEAGHRRYDESDLARLQLIRSLRELGLDLDTISGLLSARRSLAEVLVAHTAALETRIRSLQRQLAVVRAAADSPTEATLRRTLVLSKLDATERRALLGQFWDEATAGSPLDPADLEPMRRAGTPDLPDDPTPAQLDAWLELAELATDADFVASLRRAASWMERAASGRPIDARALQAESTAAMEGAVAAARDGIRADSAAARPVLRRLTAAYARALGRRDSAAFRSWLIDQLDAAHDARAERYWSLVATVRGEDWPDPEGRRRALADGFLWLMDALRHDVRPSARSAAGGP